LNNADNILSICQLIILLKINELAKEASHIFEKQHKVNKTRKSENIF